MGVQKLGRSKVSPLSIPALNTHLTVMYMNQPGVLRIQSNSTDKKGG